VLFSLFYLFFGVFDMIVSTGLLALAMMADAATTAAPVDPMEKVICRRFTETGSLAKTKRVCLTKREWVAADEKGRKFAEEVVRDGNKGATFQ
jgi:hypothetical protein